MSCKKRFRANILVWGLPKSFTTLEVRSKFVDIGLASLLGALCAWTVTT